MNLQGRWQRTGTLPVCTAGVGLLCPLRASPCQEPAGALRKQDGPGGTVMWQLWLPSGHRRNAAQGPRPDQDVFRSLFYLGKLPEAPKSPSPITPLLLLNPANNADEGKQSCAVPVPEWFCQLYTSHNCLSHLDCQLLILYIKLQFSRDL